MQEPAVRKKEIVACARWRKKMWNGKDAVQAEYFTQQYVAATAHFAVGEVHV